MLGEGVGGEGPEELHVGSGSIFELETGVRVVRLAIPRPISVVRGLIIYGNGSDMDATAYATDPELYAFAARIGFAVIGTAYWENFSDSDDEELRLFESFLERLSVLSGHGELVHVPWLPMGYSNGGQMSFGLAAKRPEKVLAFAASKGCCYNTFAPCAETLGIPGLLVAGELDTDLRRRNIRKLYAENRTRGALWAWTEESGTDHDDHNTPRLLLLFFAECYRLRYPMDSKPEVGPVILKAIDEEEGWLVSMEGDCQISPFSAIVEDERGRWGWVPSRKVAECFRVFSLPLKVFEDRRMVVSPVQAKEWIDYEPVICADIRWVSCEGFLDGYSLGEIRFGDLLCWRGRFLRGGFYSCLLYTSDAADE